MGTEGMGQGAVVEGLTLPPCPMRTTRYQCLGKKYTLQCRTVIRRGQCPEGRTWDGRRYI